MNLTNLTQRISAITMVLAVAAGAHAAQVTFSAKAPVPRPTDLSNLTGANAEANNVGEGDNDATYVADDRPVQGQTFTTATNVAGYQLRAITLRQVNHGTYALIPDLTYTLRITQPLGGNLTVIASETAKVAAAAPGNFSSIGEGDEMGNGSGGFITFTLDKPVPLKPGTVYGFDVSGGSARHYWQLDGTASDAFAGGAAYSVAARDKFTPRAGDHVFVVSMTAAGASGASQSSNAPATRPPHQQAAIQDKGTDSK